MDMVVIVAPLTSTLRNYPTIINCVVEGKSGQVALDQILGSSVEMFS